MCICVLYMLVGRFKNTRGRVGVKGTRGACVQWRIFSGFDAFSLTRSFGSASMVDDESKNHQVA